MRKVSAVMPVLIAGVVFSFIAIFLLVAQEDQTAASAAAEVSGQRSEVSAEMPALPATVLTNEEQRTKNDVSSPVPAVAEAPIPNEERRTKNEERLSVPAKGKNGSTDGVVEITVASKTDAVPESVETKGASTGAGAADAAGAAAGTSLITVAFDNVPVQDVVNMFAQISGANIIMAGSFTNMVITANLKNVEWKSALNLALGSVNLSMIEDPSGILMVVTSEMYPKKLQEIEATKPLVTRTIVPKYLNAVDLVEQVKLFKILSPRGSITTSQSANQDRANLKSSPLATEVFQNPSITTALIITDIKEYVDKVEQLVRVLDRREPQVLIEARIIDVGSDDSKKLGFDWEMLDRFGVQAGLNNLKWNYNDSHSVQNSKINKLNQYDKRSNQDDINQLYDINGQQYEETVTTDRESPPGSGYYITETKVTPTRTIADKIGQGRDITDDRSDSILDSVMQTRTASAFFNVDQISLFLSALEKNKKAEMISHPLIVVGNKVEAKIHVGERVPTISSTKQAANPQQGQTESFSETVEWNDLGLTLWVIPEIDLEKDMVRLTVMPQMAVFVKNITTLAGSVYPVISSRQVSTRANVPSKHTVVIGGLIDNQTSKIEKKVPVLGDIPLLGLLFRHTEDIVSKHNLLIMLTPTILDDRAPLTGMEAVAQLTVDKYEKIPLAAVKAVPSNAVAGVLIGTNVVTPAAGMGKQADAGSQTPDAGKQTTDDGQQAVSNAPATTPGNAVAPAPTATPLARP